MNARSIIVLSVLSVPLLMLLAAAGAPPASSTLRAAEPPAPPRQPLAPAASTPLVTWEYDQIRPAVAFGGGQYLVVWEDHHWALGEYRDIYGQRVNGDGTLAGSNFGIAWEDTKHRLAPDVAHGATANEFLVTWEYEFSATDHDIYVRRVGSDGSLPTGEIAIATSTSFESAPSVAYNSAADEYLVVWERLEGSGEFTHNDVYARRVDADGTLLGGVIGVATGTLDESAPAVAYGTTSGQYLIVWQGKQAGTGDYGIYGQRVGGDGSLAGSQISISTWEQDQIKPRLAYNSTHNDFFVVWEDHHWGASNGWDIYGQLVNGDGTLDGTHVTVASDGTKNRLNPDVTYNPLARSYMVTWEFEYSATDHDIYSRRVAYDGTRPEGEAAISALSSQEGQPAVASAGDWSFLTVWEDGRSQATQGLDVYGSVGTITLPTLSGHVYSGTTGTETDPLAGVTVALYCSNDIGQLGDLINSTTTDSQGWYGLLVYGQCEVYHIVETDPDGYVSVSADSAGGVVANAHRIYYVHPLAGKVQTDNNFRDTPEGPGDPLPPGNWANFSPTGWQNVQAVDCTVRVEDTVSGLAVNSAEYAYSTDGGGSWSGWQPASCTGSDGTTAPQTITASDVPFGQDTSPGPSTRVKFRITDMAHNVGESGSYNVLIDTVPPQNPTTLFSGIHDPSTWSNLNLVTCQWSGASDDNSGLAGYSYIWDHSPSTVPDAVVDTDMVVVTSFPMADDDDWWFHVRAVDNAGNGAAVAAHHGPFYIDTVPPESWVLSLATWQEDRFIDVSWVGDPGTGGPIAGYDVKVVDQYDGDVTTIDWVNDVTWTGTTFTGQPGHTYYFSSRARDEAGNQESYPVVADAMTTVGRDVTVRVRDEGGANVAGAKVYHNDTYLGLTDGAGTITAEDALVGDELAALYQVYEHPTTKGFHTLDSSTDWAWRVYQTSIPIDTDGTPLLHEIVNLQVEQLLTLRKDQPLIGMHVVASVEWDADSSYMDDIRQALDNANDYFYDVGDGQFFWEVIELFDNRDRWMGCDLQFHARNNVRPSASRAGIDYGVSEHINVGRYWNGGSGSKGNWSLNAGFSTLIHEFGHYGLGLWDEYLDRSGKDTKEAYCATNYSATPYDERASIMNHQYDCSELCSRVDPNHQHRTQTQHDALTGGESTWETVARRFKDSATPARWTLSTPDDRGNIVAGPDAIPVAGWVKVYVTDHDTSVCPPYTVTIYDGSTGLPSKDVKVWLVRGPDVPDMEQGVTNEQGKIVIFGAHAGDHFHFRKDTSSGWIPVSCPTGRTPAQGLAEGMLAPDPFTVQTSILPLSADTVQVQLAASVGLSAVPQAVVWQDGADAPITVTLGYDAGLGRYTGSTSLDTALGLNGYVRTEATDGEARTVRVWQPFEVHSVVATETNPQLYSTDGIFELVLPAGSLSQDAVIGIQQATAGSASQGNLVRVSAPYQVLVSTGQQDLNTDAVINMRYHDEQMAGVLTGTVQLYRWDEASGLWIPEGGSPNDTINIVSAEVDHLSTFALLAQRVGQSTRYVAPPPAGDDGGSTCTSPITPCATIQHAINVAEPGDEVYVVGGTYTSTAGAVAVITKGLSISGGFGPAFGSQDADEYPTVLDGQWNGPVISVTNVISEVQLAYLTLTHGDGSGNCGDNGCGGGIYAAEADLVVSHSVITNNVGTTTGYGWGGGFYGYESHVDVRNSRIVSNTANPDPSSAGKGYGGGIYLLYGTASLVENQVLDNLAHRSHTGVGGGIHLVFLTQADVLTNVIRGNVASLDSSGSEGYYAGGLYVDETSAAYVAGNRIEKNAANPIAGGVAGGVYVGHSDAHLARNTIISNTAYDAGGIFVQSSTPVTLSNNLIVGNEANYGGGMDVGLGSPPGSHAVLINNTVADNGAHGIMVWRYTGLTMTNNIVAGHTTGIYIRNVLTGTVVADTNLFWNDADPITGTNGIVENPLLTPDYRLLEDSPAVDAGITVPWLTTDLEGAPRPQGDSYDLGAFEGAVIRREVYLSLVLRSQ